MTKLLSGSLRTRLFGAVLLAMLVTMSVLTGLRGFYSTVRAEKELLKSVREDSTQHTQAISEALWIYDQTLLHALLQGMAANPKIAYAAVVEDGSILAEAGTRQPETKYTAKTPITHSGPTGTVTIGTLVIEGDSEDLNEESRVWFFQDLPLTLVGALIVSFFLWLLVSRIVTNRLVADAAAIEHFDAAGSDGLPFPSGTLPAVDEIALLETKFNETILELRASLSEKEVLLREIYHRTNNNMQTILGLISLGAPRTEDPAAARLLGNIESKVYAMALVHQMLYRHQDLSSIPLEDYIPQVADHLAEAARAPERGIRVDFDLEPASVTVDYAIPFALIYSELLGNALRHAYPEGRGGTIRVSLRRRPDNALAFEIADDGVGFSAGTAGGETFGLELVKSLAENQLGGTIDFGEADGGGFRCALASRPCRFKARV